MIDKVDPTKRMPRGAIPTPRHLLAAAMPHIPAASITVPDKFLMWPVQMSYWGNQVDGDCVTAEEAFAKATAAPQTFIPEATVISWAGAHGYVDGARLTDVMKTMETSGFGYNGYTYDDGPYKSVNWHDRANLHSAIYSHGPVKIGVAADFFQSPFGGQQGVVTPGTSGWALYGYPTIGNEDHCVSLCGYGNLADLVKLFQQNGVTVNVPAGMPTGMCYAMFTWSSIGIIDEQSMLNMTHEAWLRDPVTKIVNPSVYLTTLLDGGGIWAANPPSQPSQIPSTAGLGFQGVVKVGTTLYLTTLLDGGGIWTFNLASPQTKPTQISTTAGLGFRGMVVVGNTLYLTTLLDGGGIWSFDLTSQAKPTQIQTTTGLGFRGIAQAGNFLYLTTLLDGGGIWRYDYKCNTKPVQIPKTTGLGFQDLIAIGTTLYLTTLLDGGGIWTLDLTTAGAPAQISTTAGFGFQGLVEVGTTLYLTTLLDGGGIWSFNPSSPQTKPTQIATTTGLGFREIASA